MYVPPRFNDATLAHAPALMRQHPFASLVSNDDDGMPVVTHLPLHLDDAKDPWRLLGHCARANPHWRFLQQRPQALATFLGPHAYLSPTVYPDLARVPTWNYLAVHCQVEAKVLDEPQDKDELLKHLIGDHEPAYAEQWRGLDESYTQMMLGGIVAFELRVTQVQCQLKLNQHRPEAHDATVAVYSRGDDNQRALAAWMEKLKPAGKSCLE
jgi:transcriptional regulator